jgi:hypothetical protein
VGTVLLEVADGQAREMAVLESWRAAGTALVVDADVAADVAIQQPQSRLTVRLPLVA